MYGGWFASWHAYVLSIFFSDHASIADLMSADGIEINTKSVEWVLLAYLGIIEE